MKNKSIRSETLYISQQTVYGDKKSVFPYSCDYARGRRLTDMLFAPASWPPSADKMVETRNKALTKLLSQSDAAADLLAAWYQRSSTVGLLVSSLGTFVRTARAVRRRDPRIIRRVLNKNPEAKDIIRTPSGLWLQYWFAIVPTVHDIHSLLTVLTRDFPPLTVQGSASYKEKTSYYGADYTMNMWTSDEWTYICKMQADLRMRNPNLVLASRFGFTQPLSVGYELVPFSWALDYFVNVGEMLSNFEPRFPGYDITNSFYTEYVPQTHWAAAYDSRGKPWDKKGPAFSTGYRMVRTPGLPTYSWNISSDPLNFKQASYLVSVAIQLLTGMKPKK